jgi:uncharacterized DUF497 family protein
VPPWSSPEFDWDDGNVEHLIERHGIFPHRAEEVLLNTRRVRRQGDVYVALGQTDAGMRLSVIFVMRDSLIRVISAPPMSARERRRYGRN